jgi:hypothetical protein
MNRDDAKTFLVAGLIAAAVLLVAVSRVRAEDPKLEQPSTWFCVLARQHRAQFPTDRAAEDAARGTRRNE